MEDGEEAEPPEGRVASSAPRPEPEAEEEVGDPGDAEGSVEDVVVADLAEDVVDTKTILKSIFLICLVF